MNQKGARTALAGASRAVLMTVVLIGAVIAVLLFVSRSVAQQMDGPHGPYAVTTDSCAECHRSHASEGSNLLPFEEPSNLCLSCHDGTGADSDVAADYSDPSVPANDEATGAFYRHPALAQSSHTSGLDDEFAGVLNRHSQCTDCHNVHLVNSVSPAHTASGWTASGSLVGSTGVETTTPLAFKNPVEYEYELCLKCHSRYTELLSYGKPSRQKLDKAAELVGSSYHPVSQPGTNASAAMEASLAGGKLWQFDTGSTIRCVQCHGNYRLVDDPPVHNSPAPGARLAPHTSRYRSILTAGYRSRGLKPQHETYDTADFALCYLCHSETPFSEGSVSATNFPEHNRHLVDIGDGGDPALGTDIDTAGAGQGNAICAECHYRLHSTGLAYWSSERDNHRLVNFAPNVEPLSGNTEPLWSLGDRSCSLICHGETHDAKGY